jgi:hypothetical protein
LFALLACLHCCASSPTGASGAFALFCLRSDRRGHRGRCALVVGLAYPAQTLTTRPSCGATVVRADRQDGVEEIACWGRVDGVWARVAHSPSRLPVPAAADNDAAPPLAVQPHPPCEVSNGGHHDQNIEQRG